MFWGRNDKPKIHLIGIGGSGMSGIAEVLVASGFPVTGSDLARSSTLTRLEGLGAKVFVGHSEQNLEENVSCVVVSSAVKPDNIEWQTAVQRKIPVIARAEMLSELMRLKKSVAVAGSHGKTTTTSMLGQLCRSLEPTVVVGGRIQHWDASSTIGRGRYFVIEADESDKSFLKYSPVYSLVTNIDLEHLDNYRDIDEIRRIFLTFLNRTAFFGMNWVCWDCENIRKLRPQMTKPTKTYGFHPESDLLIKSVQYIDRKALFELSLFGEDLGGFELPVLGSHNVSNATAAIGMSLELGVSMGSIKRRLKSFQSADRRLQLHYEDERAAVIEDYAHHPTEIEAALSAVRLMFPDWPIKVIFQAHRYSRTKALWDDFIKVLTNIDHLHLLPIYPAHEPELPGITHQALSEEVSDVKKLMVWPSKPGLDDFLEKESLNGVFVILGAAPLTQFAKDLSQHLAANRQSTQSATH